jgi:hypothetical protein
VFISPLHGNGSSSIVASVFVAAGMFTELCLATNVFSGSAIPALRRHVSISNGILNTRNQHMWADKNPHDPSTSFQ